MGEARRRKLKDPTFGKISQDMIKAGNAFKEYFMQSYQRKGRGCWLSSSEQDNRLHYVTPKILEGVFGQTIRDFDVNALDRLRQLIATYDPEAEALHVHLLPDPATPGLVKVEIVDFPLFLIDVETGVNPRSREMFRRMLCMGGLDVVDEYKSLKS